MTSEVSLYSTLCCCPCHTIQKDPDVQKRNCEWKKYIPYSGLPHPSTHLRCCVWNTDLWGRPDYFLVPIFPKHKVWSQYSLSLQCLTVILNHPPPPTHTLSPYTWLSLGSFSAYSLLETSLDVFQWGSVTSWWRCYLKGFKTECTHLAQVSIKVLPLLKFKDSVIVFFPR